MKQQLIRTLELGEKVFQWAQGKGYGAATLRKEVGSAMPFLPSSGAVVCDIGANNGDWTRELLRRAGARVAKVYAFEPSKHNHARIAQIADPRVMLVPKAVSSSAGEAVLHYDRAGSGLASLTRRRLDHHGIDMAMEERVATVGLDAFIAEHGLDRIDFVKLDIEGHEFDAMKSAERAFSNHVIRALAFEFGGTNIDTRTYFQDIWYFLTGHGYRIARINPLFRPVPLARYSEMDENFRTSNFIAYLPRSQSKS